ncbi:MAG: glycosyltransferase family 9 protein [Flavobacteriaceae bacterium]
MKKILVIQQKMIGDVLLSSILCEWLKKKYPAAKIHYSIHKNCLPVVENNPFIDQFIIFEPQQKRSKKAFLRFLNKIKLEKYDLVVDAYGKTESILITFFSKAKKRISYKKWYSKIFYTETVKRSSVVYTNAGNALEDRLRLLIPEAGIKEHIIKPAIYLTPSEKEEAKKYLIAQGIDFNKPIIMFSVLGSSLKKSMPFEYMAKLIDETVRITQAQILFNYIPNQLEDAKKILAFTNNFSKEHIFFDIYGKGLREFLKVLSLCNLLIGNEGGAVNMAKALEIPTFTIFSPWVDTKAWNMFEDGKNNVSVHLLDFEPEIYVNKYPKEFKKVALELYKKLTPQRIIPKLRDYLKNMGY